MTQHDDLDHEAPDLVALLTGEVSRSEALAVTDHLESCPSCTPRADQLARSSCCLAVLESCEPGTGRTAGVVSGSLEQRCAANVRAGCRRPRRR